MVVVCIDCGMSSVGPVPDRGMKLMAGPVPDRGTKSLAWLITDRGMKLAAGVTDICAFCGVPG